MEQPQQSKWLGPAFVVVAILIAVYATPAPGVPAWVAYAACAVLLLIGVAFTAQAFGWTGVGKLAAPLVFLVMGVMTTWIAFGPGERHCRSGFSFLGIGLSGDASNCRTAFGVAAVLIWVFVATVLWLNYFRKPPER